MVDVFNVLGKHKDRIENIQKKESLKKIKRTITRPWQENLEVKSSDFQDHLPALESSIESQNLTNSGNSDCNSTFNDLRNYQQTDNKLPTELPTNCQQTTNKLTTNYLQTNNEKSKTANKLPSQLTTELPTNYQQTDNKLPTKTSFSSLSGLQREVTVFIYQSCKLNGSMTTGNISIKHFAESCKTSIKSLKTTIYRLKIKNVLRILSYRNGRGGWSVYELEKDLYGSMLYLETTNKLTTNCQQTDNKLPSQPPSQPPTTGPSSSSSYINTKTTTTSEPDEWALVKIPDILRLHNFGEHLVKQIRDRELLKPSELQDSLDAYAFDISENDLIKSKKISDPVRYFMSIANKKMQYAFPGNYVSDETKALEENKKRLDLLKQRREELKKVNEELAYEEWLMSLSKDQKLQFAPEDSITKLGNSFHEQKLKIYYDKMTQDKTLDNTEGLSQ